MRLLGSLLVAAILLLLLGLAMNWWSFRSETQASEGKTEITFGVDENEIRDDARRARDGVRRLRDGDDDDLDSTDEPVTNEPVQETTGTYELTGVVVAVQISPPQLELADEAGNPIELRIAEDAVIVIDGDVAELEDLQAGDRVSLMRDITDADLVRSIRVDR